LKYRYKFGAGKFRQKGVIKNQQAEDPEKLVKLLENVDANAFAPAVA